VETAPTRIAHLGTPYLSGAFFLYPEECNTRKYNFSEQSSGFQGAGRSSIKVVGQSTLGLLMEVGLILKMGIL
jgi:hypothetical protein